MGDFSQNGQCGVRVWGTQSSGFIQGSGILRFNEDIRRKGGGFSIRISAVFPEAKRCTLNRMPGATSMEKAAEDKNLGTPKGNQHMGKICPFKTNAPVCGAVAPFSKTNQHKKNAPLVETQLLPGVGHNISAGGYKNRLGPFKLGCPN